jgi:protein subunit release factor A
MMLFDINPADIRIVYTVPAAWSGQHISKTESAVRITRNPTRNCRAMPERPFAA